MELFEFEHKIDEKLGRVKGANNLPPNLTVIAEVFFNCSR